MAPPGHIFNLVGSGRVMLNILKAHTATYRALKALPGGQQAQVWPCWVELLPCPCYPA